MKRRTLLAALTGGLVGLAGCQGPFGGSDPREDTYDVPPRETTEPTTTERREAGERVPGITVDADPATVDNADRSVARGIGPQRMLGFVGRPLSSNPGPGGYLVGFGTPPNEAGPATVFVEFRATADERREYEFGPSPPFSNYWAVRTDVADYQRGYLIVPNDGRPFPYDDIRPEAPVDGQWVATERLGTPSATVETNTVELAPGESIVGEYALLRHPDAGRLPSQGTYLFGGAEWTEPSLTLSVWDPSRAPKEKSRFEGGSEPSIPDAGSTEWFHRTYPDRPRVYLEPDWERLELPRAETALWFGNYSKAAIGAGNWTLAKAHDREWRAIGPSRDRADELRYLAPGEEKLVRLTVDNTLEGGAPEGGVVPRGTFSGLGPGLYAVGIRGYGVPETPIEGGPVILRPSSETSDRGPRFESGIPAFYAALLQIEGDPVEVTATRDVELRRRENGTVVLELRGQGVEVPATEDAVLTVDRTDRTPAKELITEQVMQFPALRNAIAYFESGVRRVRVVTTSPLARDPIRFFAGGNELPFTFEGEAFFARAEETPEGETTDV